LNGDLARTETISSLLLLLFPLALVEVLSSLESFRWRCRWRWTNPSTIIDDLFPTPSSDLRTDLQTGDLDRVFFSSKESTVRTRLIAVSGSFSSPFFWFTDFELT